MSDELFNLIYNKALDLLSRREHSKREIKDKLLKRFDESDQINQHVNSGEIRIHSGVVPHRSIIA